MAMMSEYDPVLTVRQSKRLLEKEKLGVCEAYFLPGITAKLEKKIKVGHGTSVQHSSHLAL